MEANIVFILSIGTEKNYDKSALVKVMHRGSALPLYLDLQTHLYNKTQTKYKKNQLPLSEGQNCSHLACLLLFLYSILKSAPKFSFIDLFKLKLEDTPGQSDANVSKQTGKFGSSEASVNRIVPQIFIQKSFQILSS